MFLLQCAPRRGAQRPGHPDGRAASAQGASGGAREGEEGRGEE